MGIISKLILLFKLILKNKENIIDIQARSIKIDKISNLLNKFFFYYFYIYEKLNDNNKELYVQVFTKLMHIYLDYINMV